jgi:hypothetical protein
VEDEARLGGSNGAGGGTLVHARRRGSAILDGEGGRLQGFAVKANSALILRVRRPASAGARGRESVDGPVGNDGAVRPAHEARLGMRGRRCTAATDVARRTQARSGAQPRHRGTTRVCFIRFSPRFSPKFQTEVH